MIALPPFDPGGAKLIVAWALPGVAVPMVGEPGTVAMTAGPTNWPKDVGAAPTEIAVPTEKVTGSKGLTLSLFSFDVKPRVPSAVIAMPTGPKPTGNVVVTVLFVVLMTVTVLSELFVT